MKVGIIGAGQLGQMLGLAGKPLELEFTFLDPAPKPPAKIAGPVLCLPFDSDEGLRQLASYADVLTYEFENVPVEAIEKIAGPALHKLTRKNENWNNRRRTARPDARPRWKVSRAGVYFS